MLASEFDDKASVASLGSSIGSERSSRSRMLSFDGLDSIYSNTSSTEIENSSPLQFQSGPHSVQSATDIISHYPKLDTNYNATAALDHAIVNKNYSGRHRYLQGSNFVPANGDELVIAAAAQHLCTRRRTTALC